MIRANGLQLLEQHLTKPEHSILIGARQMGKTTLVKQLADKLQQKNEAVYFLTLEDPSILKAINDHPENIFNYTRLPDSMEAGKQLYIIIDEVQYANNPSNFLKLLYDKYAGKIKIIATGSSAFYIDSSFKDSLAGRKKIFELFPLAFDEFLHFKGEDPLISEWNQMQQRIQYQSLQKNKIDKLFEEYIIFGGYPAVALARTEKEKTDILNDLVTSYMKKDALEAGIKEQVKFFQLSRILADQTGSLINRNELANTLQVAAGTIDHYLYLLQKSYILDILSPYHGNVRKELTKMPKIYFNDTGLRNTLLNNFGKLQDRNDNGILLENYVYARLRYLHGRDNIHFWRTADGNEVDFILEQSYKKGSAYEVKYNDSQFKPSKYKKFTEAYPDFPLNVVSRKIQHEHTVDALRM